MSIRTCRSTLALALVALVMLAARPSVACGPFSLDAVFTFTAHPEFPLEKFAAGELGVIQPRYARSYLFVAYRQLSGNGFNAEEQKALLALWKERLEFTWPDYDEEWPKPWITARQKVPGLGAAPKISAYRHREKPNEYETYLNCQKDAFETAASVLDQRIKKFGQDSVAVRDWVAGQDQVFANCAEGQVIPPAAPADADPLLRADRAYQIAASNFYSGSFDDAKIQFEAISRDSSSPWRQTAAYLIARSLLRDASLGPAEKKVESLTEAEAQLRKILNDPGFTPVQPAAARLLNIVRLRLHPDTKLHELAKSLLKKNNETLKQDLWDYTVLVDQFAGDDSTDKKKLLAAALRTDDLTDWIDTMATPGTEAFEHSLQRWRETGSIPWLVASLSKIKANNPEATALISAAERLDQSSPAYVSTSFHEVRLALEAGKSAEARAQLDDLLNRHRGRLPASSLNLFLSLRMRLAKNLQEFLTYAQRLPAGFSWNEDEREMAADLGEDSELKAIVGRTLFDLDATRSLNEQFPLSVLQQAAESKALPEHLRRDVTQAAWLRAVLLDQPENARQLVPTLKTLVPELKPLLDDYQSALADEASKFSAIYVWLKNPGLQPVVTSGIGRRTPVNEQDSLRDNWWCSAAFNPETAAEGQGETETPQDNLSLSVNIKGGMQSPAFLSATQRATARAEHARLAALGAAPNYICRQVIQWVERHPADPRAPEALHLAVRTTRYGCTDKETGKWSKAAFDVLHKRYANSPWAKKTPYWFKD